MLETALEETSEHYGRALSDAVQLMAEFLAQRRAALLRSGR
jgi:hypothetical protein